MNKNGLYVGQDCGFTGFGAFWDRIVAAEAAVGGDKEVLG